MKEHGSRLVESQGIFVGECFLDSLMVPVTAHALNQEKNLAKSGTDAWERKDKDDKEQTG